MTAGEEDVAAGDASAVDTGTSDYLYLGPVIDFPIGEWRFFLVDGKEVGVYRREHSFVGVLNHCPHRGAPICLGKVGGTMLPSEPSQYVFGRDGEVLHCPWHRWSFDVTSGRSLFDMDRRRLALYQVVKDGESVLVRRRPLRRSEVAGSAEHRAS